MSTKHRCVNSEKSHVKLKTFDRIGNLNFASHLVIYAICHVVISITSVTQYLRVDNENIHDIFNLFDISYHKDCIIFHNIRDVLDPFSSTAFADCQRVPCSTLSSRSFFEYNSGSTYSRVVDDGFPVSTKYRCVDSEKQHVRLNTVHRFIPVHYASHFIIYIICHFLYRIRESHNTRASTM